MLHSSEHTALNASMSRCSGSQLLYPKGDKLCIVELKSSLSDPKTIKPLSNDPAGTLEKKRSLALQANLLIKLAVFHSLHC